MKSEIDQAFRRLVAQGRAGRLACPCDPKMTAFVIAGALSWIGRWYQSGGELQRRPGGRAVHWHADARRAGPRAVWLQRAGSTSSHFGR